LRGRHLVITTHLCSACAHDALGGEHHEEITADRTPENVGLDVQFYPDGDAGQCVNYLPQSQYRTAYAGNPVTIGIDTDSRSGGCQFLLRLRRF
jgi:hypothetical protein